MNVDMSPVIAATVTWLLRSYPAGPGALSATLGLAQARQAVTVAAWLRYPTAMDVALLTMVGPGGSDRLDCLLGMDPVEEFDDAGAWRTWVDEVVASWAACLLADPALALAAVRTLADSEHAAGLSPDFRRLTAPDERDRHATPLMRHPDLLAPVADLHRAELLACVLGDVDAPQSS